MLTTMTWARMVSFTRRVDAIANAVERQRRLLNATTRRRMRRTLCLHAFLTVHCKSPSSSVRLSSKLHGSKVSIFRVVELKNCPASRRIRLREVERSQSIVLVPSSPKKAVPWSPSSHLVVSGHVHACFTSDATNLFITVPNCVLYFETKRVANRRRADNHDWLTNGFTRQDCPGGFRVCTYFPRIAFRSLLFTSARLATKI